MTWQALSDWLYEGEVSPVGYVDCGSIAEYFGYDGKRGLKALVEHFG
jgi:hypothetical protein